VSVRDTAPPRQLREFTRSTLGHPECKRTDPMSSKEHAILVDLLRACPSLAAVLLRHAGLRIPEDLIAESVESTLPDSVADTQADNVIALRSVDGTKRLVIVAEIQRRKARDKPWRWLTYHVAAATRYGCEAVVLVLAPNPRVAAWARTPIPVGPSGSFAPVVFGFEDLPHLEALPERDRSTEATVLCLVAHPSDGDEGTLHAVGIALAAKAADPDEADRVRMYFSLLQVTFGQALLRAVESIMIKGDTVTQWVRDQRRQGRIEGRAEGKAEGKAEGRAEGKAESVLAILSARGLSLSAEQRAMIVACADLERLDRWITRALAVPSVDELLSAS